MGASSFNDMELDAIGEIMNISLGASATAVSTMLGTKVNITTPVVRVQTRAEFEFKRLEPAIGVEIAYVEGLEGKNIMMFRREDVCVIVGTLMGEDPATISPELDEIHISAICEVMNQMMGASATALSEFLGTIVNISTPKSFDIGEPDAFKEKYFPEENGMVVVRFRLEIEDKLNSEFMNIMSIALAKRLLEPFAASMGEAASAPQEQPAAVSEPTPEPEPAAASAGGASMSQAEMDALLASMSQPAAPEAAPSASAGGSMSQEEINAMLASSSQPAAPEAAPSGSTGSSMSQEEINAMLASSSQPNEPESAPIPQQVPPTPMSQQAPQGVQQPYYSYPSMGMDPMMLQLLNQMQQTQMQMMEMMKTPKAEPAPSSNTGGSIIRPLSSPQMDDDAGTGEEDKTNQEMLMKVPLEISVEIGRTKRLVKDILEFTQGTLVVLDKMAGEQVDLFVNGQCIARGDIVVVEDNFGIRITEIVAKELNPESL